jgi:MYXO-CTERM domain-containing protein
MRTYLFCFAAALVPLALAAVETDARACGGCFHESGQSGTVITDHRMIFRVSQQQTTLYDEIEYQGNPASFAWVLPIHGQVSVALSSDIVFAALEATTQTLIMPPVTPQCPSCPGQTFGGGSGSSSGGSSGGSSGVNVINQSTVGPYDTVQLQSSDPNALDAWLGANGYSIPMDVQPIIAEYVKEGFDFLALRLAPGQGVAAMRPVSVTSTGAGLSLPLRMVAAGTGATVGITLWVIGDGRYEPQNFQSFEIFGGQLTWDFAASNSDYTTVRAQREQTLGYAAWQIESSLDLQPALIESPILNDSADQDYLPIPASDGGADGGGSAGETADQVRQADLALLFPNTQGSVRITRMRGDLSRAALATDLALQASANQSVMSNVYQVSDYANAPMCQPCGGSTGGSGGTSGSSSGNEETGGNGKEAFGCSTASTESDGSPWTELGMGAVLGAALLRSRNRRRRR